MPTFSDDDFRRTIEQGTGIKPTWASEAFADLDDNVRQNIARGSAERAIPKEESVRGFGDGNTAGLREVA